MVGSGSQYIPGGAAGSQETAEEAATGVWTGRCHERDSYACVGVLPVGLSTASRGGEACSSTVLLHGSFGLELEPAI